MEAGTLSVRRIFGQDRRHVVPLFQRPYVWGREEQWEPFWEDMRAVAERLLDHGAPYAHFLGAIVLDQVAQPTGKMETRLIVDGQQRLTTIQVFLEAYCDLCEEIGADKHHKALLKLTRNDDPMSEDEDDEFKVWPTNVDQEHFRAVMRSESPAQLRTGYKADTDAKVVGHPIADAYLYFHEVLKEWVAPGQEGDTERLDAMLNTLRDYVRLVVIDLAEGDDPQLIFETLNARGTPLLPSDLIKNLLFHRAQMLNQNIGTLYTKYWRHFDEEADYWRQEIGRGHARRARIDVYLLHYLTLQTQDEVPVGHLYVLFREHINRNGDPESVLASIKDYADVYRMFDDFAPGSREALFLDRIRALDITTIYPFLMHLFARHSENEIVLYAILNDLESFLVRRMVCQLSTRGYNRLFIELLQTLCRGEQTPVEAVREFLLSSDAESNRWPSDEEFLGAWLENPLYRTLVRRRVRMVLEALEMVQRTSKTEKVLLEEKLTIEHIMPQQWQTNWPIEDGDSRVEREQRRNRILHTMGNLTLLNKRLNPAVSNGPWELKRAEIAEHSLLKLNQKLVAEETWDEDRIRERGESLGQTAIQVWPRTGKQAPGENSVLH